MSAIVRSVTLASALLLKIADRVIGEMLQAIGPGNEETRLFATAITHKALALAGARKRDDALWYWHTARNIDPRMAHLDLTPFGAAGAFLAENSKLRETIPVGEERSRVLRTIRPEVRPASTENRSTPSSC